MFTFKTLLVAFAASLSLHAFADSNPPYVPIELCSAGKYFTHSAFWQEEKTFCFVRDGQTYNYPISDLGKVVLRRSGQFTNSEYLKNLTPENKATIEQYNYYAVSYLALKDPKAATGTSFVAQVQFKYLKLFPQTTYVFGEVDAAGNVNLSGFSNANGWGGDIRAGLKTLRNVVLLRLSQPNRDAVNETKGEDRNRIRPVKDVVQQHKRKPVTDAVDKILP